MYYNIEVGGPIVQKSSLNWNYWISVKCNNAWVVIVAINTVCA